MFDWFKKKDKAPTNVVPFPEPKSVPAMPKVEPPPEPEKPSTVYYRLGMASDNRVSLQVGYSEITMNALGIENLIKQLELFRDQIKGRDDETN